MKNNTDNSFDQELRGRLANEELQFDPKAWEMMEEKLDDKRSKYSLLLSLNKYILSGTAFLLLLAIIYWPYKDRNFSVSDFSEIEMTSDRQSSEGVSFLPEISTTEQLTSENSITAVANENPNQTSSTAKISNQKNNHLANQSDKSSIINASNSNSIYKINKYHSSTLHNTRRTTPEPTNNSTNLLENQSSEDPVNFESISNNSVEDSPSKTRKKHNELIALKNERHSPLDINREIDMDLGLIELEQQIERPKHQINLTLGAGQTSLEIDDPIVGPIKPVATFSHEAFLSLSYLYRIRKNWGIEAGLQGVAQFQRIGHYFNTRDFNLIQPEYGQVAVNAYEFKYEVFSNIHFFLPLNQRSELDFYGGFYLLNPFIQRGRWEAGAGTPSLLNDNEISLISSRVGGENGPFVGGRIKLGLNYNFLSNKLNNIGIGIAYTQEVIDDVEGSYSLIQSTDETAGSGNLRAHGSGIKVQLTYGFGLRKTPWNTQTHKTNTGLRSPWYIGFRFGTKNFRNIDLLSRSLINANANKFGNFILGHYIKQKIALETGIEFSEFVYSTPRGPIVETFTSFGIQRQGLVSIPFALRYDVLQSERYTAYAKGVFSTDFRSNPSRIFSNRGQITDESKLTVSAGIEAGLDVSLYEGVSLGAVLRYNQAFRNTAVIDYPILHENEIDFDRITLKNQYIAWALELKYVFNK